MRNRLAQAEAGLKAAVSRRQISQTQMTRAEVLVKNGTFTEIEREQAMLELANAEAQVISAEVEVENARIAVEDTDVRGSDNRNSDRKTSRERPSNFITYAGFCGRNVAYEYGGPECGPDSSAGR